MTATSRFPTRSATRSPSTRGGGGPLSRVARSPWLTVLVVWVLVGALNAAIAVAGGNEQSVSPSWAPPGWFVGAFWFVLFAVMALARWQSHRDGDRAARTAVDVVMVLCAVYPAYSGLLSGGLTGALIGNVATLLVAGAVLGWLVRTGRPWRVVSAMVPVTLWLAFAAALTTETLRLTP